jgi:hypothetical protein
MVFQLAVSNQTFTQVMLSRNRPSVFISFRSTSGADASAYLDKELSEHGINVFRLSKQVDCPYPRDTIEEWDWLSKSLTATVNRIPNLVVIASEDAESSRWISWEIISSFGFRNARCLFICWISGEDPSKWITPLPTWAYRLFPMPSTFLIDARETLSADPIWRIAYPDPRTRIMSGAAMIFNLFVAGYVFSFLHRHLSKFGLPVDGYWNRGVAIAAAVLTLVAWFPRRAVLAYRAQPSKLSKVRLVNSGQTLTRIYLWVALFTAMVTNFIMSVFSLTQNRDAKSIFGSIFFILAPFFNLLYMKSIVRPLSVMNVNAINRGAVRTAEKIDEARRRAEGGGPDDVGSAR